MAATRLVSDRLYSTVEATHNVGSDYGSDLDEEDINNLLLRADSEPGNDIVLTSIEQDPVTEHAVIHLRSSGQEAHQCTEDTNKHRPVAIAAEIEFSAAVRPSPTHEQTTTEPEVILNDGRSPLQRFRTHPKKPLSVTDIISPAWCEQQYLYSLSKHGRVRRTPAMKQGSKVHKKLEDEVHTTVRIEVKSREDMFGLKLWNVIQGLRSLQSTGITREMEVWGLLDGQVINGVIDIITTQCPDEVFEARLSQRQGGTQDLKKTKAKLEANQQTLTTMFGTPEAEPKQLLTFYVMDVKTRQSRTLPADDGRLRPTQMQLMLYHRLLSSLASDAVEKESVFSRYNLDGEAIFSDTFIAEVSKLDLDSLLESADHTNTFHQDSVAELLANNTLSALWSHMIAEFTKTISAPEAYLSPVLAAEFRTASNGEVLGKRSFEFDANRLDGYVSDELMWWKGERPTKGVEIEEAFKCRICEFAEECSWRKEKVEAAATKSRQRKASASNG